ncbi:ABC transporter ATP-binding protein [Corynebacterium hindlerae]|uniref:ABC transporter ATP-binding protein n=1 Tax=Corynebacterium hindlerae TaxID=699041 RepID=A0A7G5FET5_9CORY|nr:ABC transporter ATP-binding protein [Corynebacterium hindlerae]QMV85126.1 ABC transporter ATP-binding protein [Corynebacterium hindlerae]
MIEVSGISCEVRGTTILHDISFTTTRTCAIVGVNGIGKSTLLRTLAGIRKAAAGQVLIDGHPVHLMKPRERATRLAFLGQEEVLGGDLKVHEVVALGRLPHMRPWEKGGNVDEALAQVGLSHLKDRYCDELSGGQRRLVLVARMIAQDTPVVLLDEPTNHLDVRHQLEILEILRGLNKVVVATMHDLDLALAHFDDVVVLHEGTVLATGPSDEVLVPENIRKAFRVQAQVVRLAQLERPHLVIEEKE